MQSIFYPREQREQWYPGWSMHPDFLVRSRITPCNGSYRGRFYFIGVYRFWPIGRLRCFDSSVKDRRTRYLPYKELIIRLTRIEQSHTRERRGVVSACLSPSFPQFINYTIFQCRPGDRQHDVDLNRGCRPAEEAKDG